MFCSKCGTQNSDTNTTCVNCGAVLKRAEELGYTPQPQQYQPYTPPQQPTQPAYDYGYTYQQPLAPQQPAGRKPTVLYIIAGVIAVLCILFLILPQFTYHSRYADGAYNIFTIQAFGDDVAKGAFNSNAREVTQSAQAVSMVVIIMFIIPLVMGFVWGLLSFLQKRPAGIFGIIMSGFLTIVDCIWLVFIGVFVSATAASDIEKVAMTPFPIIVLVLAIAALPVSIVQIVKKKYL